MYLKSRVTFRPTRYQPGSPGTSSTFTWAWRRASLRTPGMGLSISGTLLPDPEVQLVFQIATVLPGADALALDDLEVMGQTADDEHVGELEAKFVVELGFSPPS